MSVTALSARNPRELRARLDQFLGDDIAYAVKPRPTSFGILLQRKRTPVLLDIDDDEVALFDTSINHVRGTPIARVRRGARYARRAIRRLKNPNSVYYVRRLQRKINQADVVTCSSEPLRQRFDGVYLPQGKNTDWFDPDRVDRDAFRKQHGWQNRFVIMYPGTVGAHKGVEDVVVALRHLRRSDVLFALVGGRPSAREELDRVLNGGYDNVQLLPEQDSDAMAVAVASADLVVVTPRDTPAARVQFPIKLADAMAMARPIIATDVGEIPRILQGCGRVIRPGSPELLAEAIGELIDDQSAREQLGVAARKRCVEEYSLDALAARLDRAVSRLR